MADNALMERRDAGPQTGPAPTNNTPEAELEQLMRATGYKGNDPAEGMAHVWKAMPTDSNAELIEMLAEKHGLPTPWDNKSGGKMKLGGPIEREGDYEGIETDSGNFNHVDKMGRVMTRGRALTGESEGFPSPSSTMPNKPAMRMEDDFAPPPEPRPLQRPPTIRRRDYFDAEDPPGRTRNALMMRRRV